MAGLSVCDRGRDGRNENADRRYDLSDHGNN